MLEALSRSGGLPDSVAPEASAKTRRIIRTGTYPPKPFQRRRCRGTIETIFCCPTASPAAQLPPRSTSPLARHQEVRCSSQSCKPLCFISSSPLPHICRSPIVKLNFFMPSTAVPLLEFCPVACRSSQVSGHPSHVFIVSRHLRLQIAIRRADTLAAGSLSQRGFRNQ